jgi:hypothetical protein
MWPECAVPLNACVIRFWNKKKKGTFQNRAKVVDSLPGESSGIAQYRHNLAPQAKLSNRLSFNTDGTFRPL